MTTTPAKQLADVPDISGEDFLRHIADEVEASYENDHIRYNDLYERFPKSIVTVRLVRGALGTAFQIHQRRDIREIAVTKLDGLMVAIAANVLVCRDEYTKVSLHDPPLGDWCGVSGSNPVEVAYNYSWHIHHQVVAAMIPSGSKLTEQEEADAEALQRHFYRFMLWKSALKPEVILRRMPTVSNLSVRLGEPPSGGQMNVLRERLVRIHGLLRYASQQPSAGRGGDGSAGEVETDRDHETPADGLPLEATERTERPTGFRQSPALSLEQFGEALVMDARAFKKRAEAQWDLQPDGSSGQRWTVSYENMDDNTIKRVEDHAGKLTKGRAKKRTNRRAAK